MNPDWLEPNEQPREIDCAECGQHAEVFTREDGSEECNSCGEPVPARKEVAK